MGKDTGVQRHQPGTFSGGPLTEVLCLGARHLLARAVEMQVMAFVEGALEALSRHGRTGHSLGSGFISRRWNGYRARAPHPRRPGHPKASPAPSPSR